MYIISNTGTWQPHVLCSMSSFRWDLTCNNAHLTNTYVTNACLTREWISSKCTSNGSMTKKTYLTNIYNKWTYSICHDKCTVISSTELTQVRRAHLGLFSVCKTIAWWFMIERAGQFTAELTDRHSKNTVISSTELLLKTTKSCSPCLDHMHIKHHA